MYDPTIDMETVEIAVADKVYIRRSFRCGTISLMAIKFSDCPTNNELTALKDSRRGIPLILDKRYPIPLIINGKIRRCWRIPINAEIKMIGHNTNKKKLNWLSLTRPPKTKSVPTRA